MSASSSVIRLRHPDTEGEIRIMLPMSMTIAGKALTALGRCGFELQPTDHGADGEATA